MSSSHGTVQNSVVDQLIHSGVQFARSSLTQPIAVLTENNHSPSQLVLLLPLLASTANLTFSAAEFLTIRPLVADRGDGGEKELQPRAVQRWWEGFWIPGLGVVVGLGLGAVGGGIRAAMRSPGAGGGYGGRARLWYGAGVFFAGAHFAFAPKVAGIIKTIVRGSPKNAVAQSRLWLDVHASRTVLTDIPAFLCFLLANMSR